MSSENINKPSSGEKGMEERLWDYMDGLSAPAERSLISRLVEEDLAWKKTYRELMDLKDLLHNSETDQPSMRFTRNVMEEIARLHIAPAAKQYINNKLIWGIGLFFITMLLGTLVLGFSQMFSSPGESGTVGKEFDKIDFSRFFNNNMVNAMMMINVVIGLFLLDNYLSLKRKKFRNEV